MLPEIGEVGWRTATVVVGRFSGLEIAPEIALGTPEHATVPTP